MILRFASYTINLRDIRFPARCIKCPLNNCTDLTKFLILHYLNQN